MFLVHFVFHLKHHSHVINLKKIVLTSLLKRAYKRRPPKLENYFIHLSSAHMSRTQTSRNSPKANSNTEIDHKFRL